MKMAAMKRWYVAVLVAATAVVAVLVWPRGSATTPAETTAQPARQRAPGAKLDPAVLPTATIDGLVHDSAQKPLANARVCVVAKRDQTCATTGANGTFEIAAPPDDVAIAASLAKYQPYALGLPRLDPGERRTVDIELRGGGVELTGVVEDILGGPIAKAEVSAGGMRIETDDEGRFSIWMPPDQGFQFVHARATGYGPRTQSVKPPARVAIALAPESAIAGKVVDAVTGAPVANARVTAEPNDDDTMTGTDGTFTLDGLAAGDMKLAASTQTRYGRLDRRVELGVGERVEGIVIEVHPARSIVATIELAGDRAICNPTPALSDWHFRVADPWRDETGRYHFDGVPPGVYMVTLGCGAVVSPLTVGEGDLDVTWRVDSGGLVKGKLVGAAAPDGAYTVELAREGSRRPPLVTTPRDNRFELVGVPPGTYTLRVLRRFGATSPGTTIEVKSGQTIVQDITLAKQETCRITGKVTYKSAPVTVATVRLYSNEPPAAYSAPVKNGRYEIDVIEGRYDISAYGTRVRGNTNLVAVKAGETVAADIELEEAPLEGLDPFEAKTEKSVPYSLGGRVVDERGQPVADAIVTANQGYREAAEDRALRATTDSAGAFSLVSSSSSLQVDIYRVGGGHARATILASEGKPIVLRTKTQITGRVLRADGSPATRFQLRIGDGGNARTENFDYTGGRFAIEDRGEYPLVLSAQINGLAGETVTLDAPTSDVTLSLPKTITITGRIVDGGTRAPITNVRINGRQGLDGWAPWFIHGDQVTDDAGRFTMRDLPPGPLMLEITPPVETWSAQTVNVTVPDVSGDIGEFSLAQSRKR